MQEVLHPDSVRLPLRIGSMAIAAGFLIVAMLAGYRYIGWPPVIIVGGSGAAAFVLWSLTYLRRPVPADSGCAVCDFICQDKT
jgi:hypothetical protein